MNNYNDLSILVKRIASKTNSGKYVFWGSKTGWVSENNYIYFHFDYYWCLIYDTRTKIFSIPSVFYSGSLQNFQRLNNNYEQYIFSTGDSAVDFQNSLLYNVVYEGDETFDCIFEYMLEINIIKYETL